MPTVDEYVAQVLQQVSALGDAGAGPSTGKKNADGIFARVLKGDNGALIKVARLPDDADILPIDFMNAVPMTESVISCGLNGESCTFCAHSIVNTETYTCYFAAGRYCVFVCDSDMCVVMQSVVDKLRSDGHLILENGGFRTVYGHTIESARESLMHMPLYFSSDDSSVTDGMNKARDFLSVLAADLDEHVADGVARNKFSMAVANACVSHFPWKAVTEAGGEVVFREPFGADCRLLEEMRVAAETAAGKLEGPGRAAVQISIGKFFP